MIPAHSASDLQMQNLRDQHTSTSPTKHQQTNANGNQSTDAPPWMGGDGGNAERGEIGIADADAERDNHQQTTLTQQELGGDQRRVATCMGWRCIIARLLVASTSRHGCQRQFSAVRKAGRGTFQVTGGLRLPIKTRNHHTFSPTKTISGLRRVVPPRLGSMERAHII